MCFAKRNLLENQQAYDVSFHYFSEKSFEIID